jgi:hypothetical protein
MRVELRACCRTASVKLLLKAGELVPVEMKLSSTEKGLNVKSSGVVDHWA